jgi:hypothetical protein
MTTNLDAKAFPRKRFFLEMFTRDISLEDCILDLIDNSIDALVRTIQLDISANILVTPRSSIEKGKLPQITLSYNERQFKIVDNCGGIDLELALKEVFCFGHGTEGGEGQLGAYGIGMKRALFKIGNHFEIKSKTTKNGFTAAINVNEWSKEDKSLDDWKIPLKPSDKARSLSEAGTSIVITELRPEVRARMVDGSLDGSLRSAIAQTYSLFLGTHAAVSLNDKVVNPLPVPLGRSEQVEPAVEDFKEDGVTVKLVASLASRSNKGEWSYDRAGWYVLCNGRIVLSADKTEVTGWGVGLPLFHSKYNGFVGLAFFSSPKPLLLPWTTTKRGLNRESRIYQRTRNKMIGVGRPIITFLNKMYPSEPDANRGEREIADRLESADVREMASRSQRQFKVEPSPKVVAKSTVRISYEAEIDDVARIKKHVRQPSWGANKVGRHTFDYFLKQECPE